jgi:2-dehydro-3-deoxyphosphogluconate aldolase/(4S)-4-hydroxy-2-oxoglutarate aldolase
LRKEKAVEVLRRSGHITAVQVSGEQQLIRAVAALAEGGVRAVELSYATVRSVEWLVQTIKANAVLVGVGGITRSSQARESGMLGADFVTAAVTAPDVVAACKDMGIPCILTSLTPTEVWRAQEMEADFVRVPAEALGGPDYVRSLRETLSTQHLVGAEMPLNGYLPYLEAGVEVLEFKSSLALPKLVAQENWAEISRRISKIVSACDAWRASRDEGF